MPIHTCRIVAAWHWMGVLARVLLGANLVHVVVLGRAVDLAVAWISCTVVLVAAATVDILLPIHGVAHVRRPVANILVGSLVILACYCRLLGRRLDVPAILLSDPEASSALGRSLAVTASLDLAKRAEAVGEIVFVLDDRVRPPRCHEVLIIVEAQLHDELAVLRRDGSLLRETVDGIAQT